MSLGSSIRRRLLAAVLTLCSLVVIYTHKQMSPKFLAMAFGPMILMYGLIGLVFPLAMHDPKPEMGQVQHLVEGGRWEKKAGVAAMLVGLAIGIGWWSLQ